MDAHRVGDSKLKGLEKHPLKAGVKIPDVRTDAEGHAHHTKYANDSTIHESKLTHFAS